MKKSRTAVLAITAALVSGTLAAPGASAAEVGDHLFWGIRSSFNNYVHGYTKLDGGATPGVQGDSKGFNFELKNQNYDAANKKLTAEFSGTVIYKQYCEGQQGNDKQYKLDHECALDLTIKDPIVVLDDDEGGSYVEATVRSRQYQGTNAAFGPYFAPDHPVRIVDLYPEAAFFKKEGNLINWEEIPSNITEDGNRMMSNFYNVGEGMDPLYITYHGEGDDITSPDALPAYPHSWESPLDYTDHVTRLFDDGTNIIVSVGGHTENEENNGFYLVDPNLKQVASLKTSLSQYGVVAYDSANKLLYYSPFGPAGDKRSDKLMAVKVTKTGFGEPQEVFSGKGEVLAVGYHPKAKVVTAITQARQENPATQNTESTIPLENENPATMVTIKDGKTTEVTLPDSKTLLGKTLQTGTATAYRFSSFSTKQIREMLPMDDGTFVFSPSSNPKAVGNEDEIKNILISIDPEATTGAEAAKFMPNSVRENDKYRDNVFSNGSQIIRANSNDSAQLSQADVLTYKNRSVSVLTPPRTTPGFEGWGGGAYDIDGNPVILSGAKSKLVWFNPKTFEVIKEASVPNGRETYNQHNGDLIARDNNKQNATTKSTTFFVPTLDESKGDYVEYYKLRRLFNPRSYEAPSIGAVSPEELKKQAEVEKAQHEVEAAKNSIKAIQEKIDKANASGDTAAAEAAQAELKDAQAELARAEAALKEARAALGEEPAKPSNPQTPSNPGGNNPQPTDNGSSELTKDQKDGLGYGLGAAFGTLGVVGLLLAILMPFLRNFILHSPLASVLGRYLR